MEFTLRHPYPLEAFLGWRPAIEAADEAAYRRVLADPSFRKRLKEESASTGVPNRFSDKTWPHLTIMEVDARPSIVTSRARRSARWPSSPGRHPFDVFLDFGLDGELDAMFDCRLFNTDENEVRKLLRHPNAAVALSDAGAHLSFLCDAGFGLHLFGHWVRERGDLTLEEAVKRVTSDVASAYRITERGRLAAGAWADLILFDPQTVARGDKRRVNDLPTGASRLDTPAVGLHGVWVNGVRTVDERGRHRRLRPARPRAARLRPVKTRLPGPRGGFFFGSAGDFRRDQLGFYVSCARQYGDFVQTRMGPYRIFMVFHPDAIEELLVARNRDFIKSPGVRLLRPVLGDGLLLSEGDTWLRQRRLVQPAFHRQRVAGYGEVMATLRRAPRGRAGRTATRVDVNAEMMALTQAIVAKTLFDADVSGDAHEAGQAAEVLMHDFGVRLQSFRVVPHWIPTPGNLRSRRAIRRLDQLIHRIIDARRASGEDRGDLLSILVHAQDADDGSRMTARQVRDEVMTLFMAGHETTAVTLSWTWYLLAQHPEVEARLADELRDGARRPRARPSPIFRG